MPSTIGNRITDNAFGANDGRDLISRAFKEIHEMQGWRSLDEDAVFSGVYYDSAKVGSYISRVINERGEHAVLKIQLKPLLFDEGLIIRHVEKENRSTRIGFPHVISDEKWNESRGYGYLVFEDASHFPDLWTGRTPNERDLRLHQDFLREFTNKVLPISPWFPRPDIDPKAKYREAFEHFHRIAETSNHRHIDLKEIDSLRDIYFTYLDRLTFEDFHFTHGHLSGKDIKYDEKHDRFIVFANLYWSYRPRFYEITFPTWVELMHIQDSKVGIEDFQRVVNRWSEIGMSVYGDDLCEHQQYWFNLLERAITTIMLDLGSSEWKEEEVQNREALLVAWKSLFRWLVKEKM